jgi:hypothetical protein
VGDTIRTFKATFPDNPHKRDGFLRVANSEHVAQKLADADIKIGDWKSPEAMQVEQSNRFARDAAEESKKALDESMTHLKVLSILRNFRHPPAPTPPGRPGGPYRVQNCPP